MGSPTSQTKSVVSEEDVMRGKWVTKSTGSRTPKSSHAGASSKFTFMSETSASTCGTDDPTIQSGEPKGSKLLLSLRKDENDAAQDTEKITLMANLKEYFMQEKFGFKVEIGTVEDEKEKFVLFFTGEQEANRALSLKDMFDYDLTPFVEPTKKKTQRPTPSNPLRYKVLNRSRLRGGKSMKSEWQGDVYKGEIVWVNQIKGRRARVIDRSNGTDTVRGWVSLRSNNGFQLLTQFHDNE